MIYDQIEILVELSVLLLMLDKDSNSEDLELISESADVELLPYSVSRSVTFLVETSSSISPKFSKSLRTSFSAYSASISIAKSSSILVIFEFSIFIL